MCTTAELSEVAYKKEKSAALRLTKRQGLSTEAALTEVLSKAAGTGSLAELVNQRLQEKAHIAAKVTAHKQTKLAARAHKQAARQPDADAWLAWFDGSCHPNPGKMGIGGLLKSPQGKETEISFIAGIGDSSEAEYIALISVLETAIQTGADKLLIYGDSQVVINDVQSRDNGAAILSEQRLKAQDLIASLPQVSLQWIPRKRNGQADALSQRAIRNAAAAANPQQA
ncbi:RNase HI-like protein [Herminiimonas sp. KBW02]|nr:RNase HI-like protein [Herminiimonas sp. KBW02]